MAKNDTIKCYCLVTKEGKMHCPLTTDMKDLENTFNYQLRGEKIIWVEIDKNFVCTDTRNKRCKNCPFNV